MRHFSIKSADSVPSVLELMEEIENGYYVRIIRNKDGWEEVKDEFLSHDLFDTCLRTGYLTAMSA